MSRHPAPYHQRLLDEFKYLINAYRGDDPVPLVLDPFAGTGRIHRLQDDAMVHCTTIGVEIEPEWAAMHRRTVEGNALDLPDYWSDWFDFVITSPTYGNRMADHHTPSPEDTSRRNTYRHALGRPLHEESSGKLQWGAKYTLFHRLAWMEVWRVLRPGGVFILNIKDHVRGGEIQPVSKWHADTCSKLGFDVLERREIRLPGMRQGANADKRLDYENVYVFRKPNPPTPQPKKESE